MTAKVEIFSLRQNCFTGQRAVLFFFVRFILTLHQIFFFMNLTIDAGNTSVKLVLFDRDKQHLISHPKKFLLKDLKNIFSKFPIQHTIISSVVETEKNILHYLRTKATLIELDSHTKIPIKNKYKSSATLGSDRLAAVVGAAKLFPGSNVLVIDAGTCVKYDFVNSKKEYLGGSISPGLRMRFEALHNFTNRLPFIQQGKYTKLIGTTTKDSILTGVQSGMVHEMNGFIEQYKNRYRTLQVVMSGGDAPLFAGRIKSSIFAAPNLIQIGLNEILKYNVEQE